MIHSENILLENIYVNSTDSEHAVDFDFSSLNVRLVLSLGLRRSADMVGIDRWCRHCIREQHHVPQLDR